jgi:hypothetical protein
MPTGYTSKLHDKDQSFEEVVWTCARAFGALFHMRDDGLDAPLQLHEPDTANYGARALEEEGTELERLRKLSRSDCDREAAAEYATAVDQHMKYEAEKNEVRKRYVAMLDQVQKWKAPTPDHEGLRKFMVEQLQEALRWGCNPSDPPKQIDGYTWVQRKLEHVARVISVSAESAAKQESARRSRREWVDALAKSVPPPKEAKR